MRAPRVERRGRRDPFAVLADAANAAPALLGWLLVRRVRGRVRAGVIVETEAYTQDDPACHAHGGRTRRNASLFGPAGSAYVYRIHRSICFNVVTGSAGLGEAVLVRAIEPTTGLHDIERARARATVGSAPPSGYDLTNGPGKLCQALGIELCDDGTMLTTDTGRTDGLFLVPGSCPAPIDVSPRVGISHSREAPLRFFLRDNPWVSRPPVRRTPRRVG